MNCRDLIRGVRVVVWEHEAAATLDALITSAQGLDDFLLEIEMKLAVHPDEIGIRGVVCDGLGLGFYLYVSTWGALDILYRYDQHKVYIESIAVDERVSMRIAS
jgi:hypothetical protein